MESVKQIQSNIEILRGKVRELDGQLEQLRKDIDLKRQAAGAAYLENKVTETLEQDIFKLESKTKTLEHAKQAAETQIIQAIKDLDQAKINDAGARVKQIRTELDRTANDLEKDLTQGLESAQRFEGLLSEAWGINRMQNVPLSPLDTWVMIENPSDPTTHFDYILEQALSRLRNNKPKGG